MLRSSVRLDTGACGALRAWCEMDDDLAHEGTFDPLTWRVRARASCRPAGGREPRRHGRRVQAQQRHGVLLSGTASSVRAVDVAHSTSDDRAA
jgi:hypothetical protein